MVMGNTARQQCPLRRRVRATSRLLPGGWVEGAPAQPPGRAGAQKRVPILARASRATLACIVADPSRRATPAKHSTREVGASPSAA